jgi:hypothetical protein
MKQIKWFLFLLITICCFKANSQFVIDTNRVYLIETTDGNEYLGKILSDDSYKIVFKTNNIGIITINRSDISKIKEIKKEQIIGGAAWYENLQSTRYYWAPNGYGLKKGEGYYQNMWILYNQAGYGFSDKFSIGAGLLPFFLFGGAPTPVWIAPKFSIPIKKDDFNLGAGILAATIIGEDNASFGIAYGVSTFGTQDKNFTLGMGYGYAGGDWAKRPIIMASTMLRTGKKGYFISENYYIPTGDDGLVLIMIGGRSLIKKVALDYGLVMPFSQYMEEFVAIPWLGISIPLEAK